MSAVLVFIIVFIRSLTGVFFYRLEWFRYLVRFSGDLRKNAPFSIVVPNIKLSIGKEFLLPFQLNLDVIFASKDFFDPVPVVSATNCFYDPLQIYSRLPCMP